MKPAILTLTLTLTLTLALAASSSFAFSLLGPYDGYQIQRLSYAHTDPDATQDIGGPMNLGEEYRWNIRTITYAIDPSFVDYFGQKGVEEIRKAIAILNALPPFSKMSDDLSEFPLGTRRVNYEASGLFLLDLKSEVLGALMEHLGLASPERYAWTLRNRIPFPGNVVEYWVIMRNFDPVTREPSKYVNGTLFSYAIFEFSGAPWDYDWADAIEFPVDPLALRANYSVASVIDGLHAGFLGAGEYLTGLTRDDIGGLRYLYRQENRNVETPLPDLTLAGGIPGTAVDPANTNNIPVTALRPGVDKINFVEAKFDSVLGPFVSVTNRFVDYYVTNGILVRQQTQRILNAPDILFAAADIADFQIFRTDTANWINNDAVNGSSALAGPGVIAPGSVITFSTVGPLLINVTGPGSPFLAFQEGGATPDFVWGAFDATTNRPIVFPSGASIDEFENRILRP